MGDFENTEGDNGVAVAIVGMAARFPGAPDVDTFWRNLREGVESITHFSDAQLEAMGVDRAWLRRPDFVKAGAVLERPGRFDAAFFGYSPREAELLDPQHRAFLECAWQALENAGYNPSAAPGVTGVFAGSSLSSYLLFNLLQRPEIRHGDDTFPVMVANDKDFLATRVAYHLNLKGPSVTVQTGCSTSLVATHLACQALIGFQCDLALAGGVSIHMPQRTGYFFQEGGITSPDGHCRAFDAKGQGTLFGSGVGVVVLKRLEDALADGDTIHAVIKGSAINNDGAVKVGYTAPGVEGQAEVIARAQAVAEVSPESIQYVEAHGTATPLGDPVEVSALTQAFRAGTERKNFCGLGAVKSNIGHLDAAAGVAGLIKTTLALEHGELPPTLHFETPNPRIDFANSPFYVNAALKPWPATGGPRRAGVSSFGIGGTNAHLILEQAPPAPATSEAKPHAVLLLSAKTPSALEAQTAELLAHLEAHPEQALADVAYTLQVGRKAMEHRRALVCQGREDAIAALKERSPERLFTLTAAATPPPLVFMFAGGGAQYVDMGRGVYASEPVFREAVDRCCELLKPRLGFDLRTVMYPKPEQEADAQQRIKRTSVALPALFAVEYAMAQLWMSWGLKPEAMIGHSLGEYAAACLAGVFSVEDALSLVMLRGKLFEELPSGAMLSVPLPEEEVRALLGDGLSLAAVNGPSQGVIAGAAKEIDALAAELSRREIEYRQIQIDVAAHSHLVDPILGRFQAFVSKLKLGTPTLPFVSNVTGTWITPAEATDPNYWVRHLRHTVRFGDGVRALRENPARVFLEVSPGRTLSTLVRLQSGNKPATILSSLRHPQDRVDDRAFLLSSAARLWLSGVELDFAALHRGEKRRRVPLPDYPFEGSDFWLKPEAPSARRTGLARKHPDVAGWFYLPAWRRAPLPVRKVAAEPKRWLVFLDAHGVGARLCELLARAGHEVTGVIPGETFGREAQHRYAINPRQRADYQALAQTLAEQGTPPERVAYLWSLAPLPGAEQDGPEQTLDTGFLSLLMLAQALGEAGAKSVELWAAASHGVEVESADPVSPERAMLLTACKVIPQEQDELLCHYVDVGAPSERLADQLFHELTSGEREPAVALRGPHRYVQLYEPVRIEDDAPASHPLKRHGVYLVTGGLGGVGLRLAEHLARSLQARLVLVGRSPLPPRSDWPRWLAADEKDPTRRRIRTLQAMEAMGAEVLALSADVSDEASLRAALAEAEVRFGDLDGVIHAAGLAGEKAVSLIPSIDPTTLEQHLAAKARGVQVLERVLRGRDVDLCLLISSNAAVLGGLGLAAYGAANAYMDAFAAARARLPGTRWISANWDGWPGDDAADPERTVQTSIDQFAMTAAESVDAFRRVAEGPFVGQVVVSTGDLDARLAQWIRREAGGKEAGSFGAGTLHARPALGTEYVAPSTELERTIVQVWQELLGVEQLGVYDNFFDLGGNSLIWLKAQSRLKKELRRDIPLTAVFESPTANALAKKLGQAQATAAGDTQALEASQSRGSARRERRSRRE